MNTAYLSLEPIANFDFAPVRATVPRATVSIARYSDAYLFGQLAAFCTRVLLLGGRSPLEEPMLSRDLLSVYSFGALELMADEAGLDATSRTDLAARLMSDVIQLAPAEATLRASALMNAPEWATTELHEILRRGADAFAQWLVDPADFVPEDFRRLVAANTAHVGQN
jgi:hypothetical protein